MRGDRRAFELLIDRFDIRLLYYVRKLIDDSNHAQDIVQETWVCAFRSLPRLRDPKAFQSWLYRIAHGYVAKELHRHYRRREDQAMIDVVDESFVEDEMRVEQAAVIHAALSELSPPHREILLLRFMEDFSIEEIANTLDLPPGSVKSRLHYAKNALRTVLTRLNERP